MFFELTGYKGQSPSRYCRLRIVLSCCLVMTVAQCSWSQESNSPVDNQLTQTDFYRPDEIQTIELKVAEQDMQRLLAALPDRIYVPASFRWRDISIPNVGIRFKGNSSSAPQQKHKRSFLIKLDEYTEDQRFLGLRRTSLDNGVQFGSVFSEPIITEILAKNGIKAHRCNYAKLLVNGKNHGVYVNVERIDETFIQRNFPGENGLLFKVDEGGPASNLQFIGDDPAIYQKAFEPQSKASKMGQQKLVDFIRMINQSNDKEIAANLESQMELDDFISVTAILLFSGAFDQLTGWNPHNYYLYRDGTNDRWRYLPWDLDVGFCESAFGQIQVLSDWNAAWPAAGQMPNPLLNRIVNNAGLLKRYRERARIILEKSFEPEALCATLDKKYSLIKTELAADPFPHRRVTNPEDKTYDDIVASMKRFIRKRYASAVQQLENPGQRPKMTRQPMGPPPQLVEKIQRIQRGAERLQTNGKDVGPLMKFMQQVGPMLQKGEFAKAEKLVDEALKLIEE